MVCIQPEVLHPIPLSMCKVSDKEEFVFVGIRDNYGILFYIVMGHVDHSYYNFIIFYLFFSLSFYVYYLVPYITRDCK